MGRIEQRHTKTLSFLKKHIPEGECILDLGVKNNLSVKMSRYYDVVNTTGQDLDIHTGVKFFKTITAFEIFEHLFAPFNILSEAKGKLIASVPLNIWWQDQWWNDKDLLDCHYHEFTTKQFLRLLERTGWTVLDSELIKTYEPLKSFRFRQGFLRRFYPRILIVYATK